ncbi:MAG: putative aminohydrolase SsnA [Anaerorhabdus sp.]
MYIIGNGKVFTRDANNPYIEDGAVVFDGKLIKEVGKLQDLKAKYIDAEFIDANGQYIMPAFINVHNHIYSALGRGISIKNHNPTNFIEILEGLWWNLDNHLKLKDSEMSARATYINCIENGVTTIFDHHASYGETLGSLKVIGDIAKEYGVRSCLCYEVSDRHGEEKMKEAVKENVDFYNYTKNDSSDMLKAMMGLHASFTLSDKTMEYVIKNTPSDCGYHIHVEEGLDDVIDAKEKYNTTVVERLNDLKILGPNTMAVHCIHGTKKELDILKETDTIVVHNPESNMGNAVGAPNAIEIFKTGVLYGLGTDGYTNDMLESYKVANCLQKHDRKDPSCAWMEIPTMLFENNAEIANRFFKIPLGKLKEGYSADIILVDYTPLTPMNENNLNSHLLFGINGSMVTSTIGSGKILMRDRKLVNIDKSAVLEESRMVANDLWKRINNGR